MVDEDVKVRFLTCFDAYEDLGSLLDKAVSMIGPILYLIGALITFLKYGRVLKGQILFLLISWSIESIWDIVYHSLKKNQEGWDDGIDVTTMVFTEVNFLIFIHIMFRIRNLQIYMDEENYTE